jgi:sugar lactone lactonase YvrE
MNQVQVLADGLTMGESVRWHNGRTWLCDWGTQSILAIDHAGSVEKFRNSEGLIPWTIDWLPDGSMLVVSRGERFLRRVNLHGLLEIYADLGEAGLGEDLFDLASSCNEMVVDGRGNAYINAIGYNMMAGEAPRPGVVLVVAADGAVRQVADDVHFPNGMAITADGSTLIVAESHARRLTAFTIEANASLSDRRVWADLGTGTPDGICIDSEGAIWYADVPNACCVRVREGGEVADVIQLDRGAFSCALGGQDRRTLLIAATVWRGADTFSAVPPPGQLLAVDVDVPAAGWPSP